MKRIFISLFLLLNIISLPLARADEFEALLEQQRMDSMALAHFYRSLVNQVEKKVQKNQPFDLDGFLEAYQTNTSVYIIAPNPKDEVQRYTLVMPRLGLYAEVKNHDLFWYLMGSLYRAAREEYQVIHNDDEKKFYRDTTLSILTSLLYHEFFVKNLELSKYLCNSQSGNFGIIDSELPRFRKELELIDRLHKKAVEGDSGSADILWNWIDRLLKKTEFEERYQNILNHSYFFPYWQNIVELKRMYYRVSTFVDSSEPMEQGSLLSKGMQKDLSVMSQHTEIGPKGFSVDLHNRLIAIFNHLADQAEFKNQDQIKKIFFESKQLGHTRSKLILDDIQNDAIREAIEIDYHEITKSLLNQVLHEMNKIREKFRKIKDEVQSTATQTTENFHEKLDDVEKPSFSQNSEKVEVAPETQEEVSAIHIVDTAEEEAENWDEVLENERQKSLQKRKDQLSQRPSKYLHPEARNETAPLLEKLKLFGRGLEVYLAAGMGSGVSKDQKRKSAQIKNRDFEQFLTQLGTIKSLKGTGNGSQYEYLLPNRGPDRELFPFKKYRIHLAHSGSESIPRKTLRIFLKSALMDSGLFPNMILN